MHRSFMVKLLAALLLAAPIAPGVAETFPARPIQIIVPLTAGSVLDLLARAMAEAMGQATSQSIMVLNREGAGGSIGATLVSRAKPDGYTIAFGGDSAVTVQPHVTKDLGYTIDSFDYICQTNISPIVIAVGPNSPFQTFAEFVAAARKTTRPLTYGTTGNAQITHLVGESMVVEGGLKLAHVPFRSVADMNVQTINGSVDFTITLPNILTLGRGVRGLALASDEPMEALPTVPLLGTQGFKRSVMYSVHMMYAPRGLPPETLGWLRKACGEAAKSNAFRTMTGRTFTIPRHIDGAEFAAIVRRDAHDRGELIRSIGLRAE